MAQASSSTERKKAITDAPHIVVSRLPLYLRALTDIEQGEKQVTSKELGDRLGISSAQIRKDLSYFGEFGKQGTGYEVDRLKRELEFILNVDRQWRMVLVGVGDLGQAILAYSGFAPRGFSIAAAFDQDPDKTGKVFGDVKVQHIDSLAGVIRREGIEIAIIAIPVAEAQCVVDRLVETGIRAILNYAPLSLDVPPEVQVHNIDPVVGLQSMTYYLDRH